MNYADLTKAAIDRQAAYKTWEEAQARYRKARTELRLARHDAMTALSQLQRMEERIKHVTEGGELGPRLVPCETGPVQSS